MYIFLWDKDVHYKDTRQVRIFFLSSEERKEKWDNNFRECLAVGWESRGWGKGVSYLVVPFIADCLLRQFAYSDTMEVFLRLCNLCKVLIEMSHDAPVRPWTICGREAGLTVNCAASELIVLDRCLHLFVAVVSISLFYLQNIFASIQPECMKLNWGIDLFTQGGQIFLEKTGSEWLEPLKSKMFSCIHVIGTEKCG